MQDSVLHTFEGGLNQDISKSRLQANQYTDAKNITLSFNEDTELASITNSDGNSKQFSLPYLTTNATTLFVLDRDDDSELQSFLFADIEVSKTQVDANGLDYRIVGYTTIRNTLIILSRPKTDVNGLSLIWTINLDTPSDPPVLKYVGLLNFPLSPIDVEGNYESETIQKIYWADGTNELGHFNIADVDGYKLNADQLSYSPKVTYGNITIDGVLDGGELPYGLYQYAYSYYNLNGAESPTSDVSDMVYLYPTAESLNLYGEYVDISDETVNVSKTIEFTIDNIDSNWDFITIYRIRKTSVSTATVVEVIKEVTASGTSMTITDNILSPLRTITTTEFAVNNIKQVKVPENLISKDNRLLIGNIDENLYAPDYDTRAYRFYSSDDGSYTTDVEIEQTDTTLDNYTDYTDVPSTHDAINPDNDLQEFPIDGSVRAFRKGFAASTNTIYERGDVSEATSGIGGSGENVSYYFVYENIEQDTDITNAYNITGDKVTGPDNISGNKGSYLRDEIYRMSAILVSTSGQKSLPKWIGDIRMPSAKDVPPSYVDSGVLYSRNLYPVFTFSNLPDDCAGVIITYVPRELKDKTIVAQGVVLPTRNFEGEGESGATYKLMSLPDLVTGTSPSTDLDNYATTRWFMDQLNGGSDTNGTTDSVDTTSTDIYDRTYLSFHSPDLITRQSKIPSNAFMANEYIQGYLVDNGNFETFHREPTDTAWYTANKQNSVVPFSNTTDRYQNIEELEYLNSEGLNFDGEIFKYRAGWTNKGDGAAATDSIEGVPYPTLIFRKASNARYKNPSYDSGTYGENHLITITNLKVPITNQYNGQGYSARLTNEYIQGSAFTTDTTVYADKGDIQVQLTPIILARSKVTGLATRASSSIYLGIFENHIVQEKHNTYVPYRNITFDSMDSVQSYLFTLDKDLDDTLGETYYEENPLLDIEYTNIIRYFAADNTPSSYPNQFQISEIKFESELIDSWLDFKSRNFINVNGKYGPINAINEINDEIIYFQDNAIGQLSINPRAIASTSEGDITLGTGGILDDYKYISTTHGCKNRESIVKTPKGLYYYDNRTKKLRVLGDEQQPLSDIKGLHTYLQTNEDSNTNPIQADGVTAGYDYINNKVYFTFHASTPFTVVFDETFGNIESFIDCNPLLWISTRQGLFSTMSESDYSTALKADDFYKMNAGNKSTYFGTSYDSYITFLFNKNPQVLKVPNNIEYFMQTFDSSGDELTTDSFDYIRVWNNYQNTTKLPLTQSSNRLHIHDRKWRLFIPRNYKPYNPTLLTPTNNNLNADTYVIHPVTFYLYKVKTTVTNYDLLSTNDLDQDKFEKVSTRLDRIRDFFSYINLEFTNSSDKRFVLNDLLIKYDF